jgi:DNA-binding GntR family transcriptional regulator
MRLGGAASAVTELRDSTDTRGVKGGYSSRVHARLRELILQGEIAPGSVLSQVELADALGVSRTPLREALRMLQEEGLVTVEPNRPARVIDFDPEDLDSLYARRVMLESLGIVLTIPGLNEEDFEAIDAAMAEMSAHATNRDRDRWEEAHRRFHLCLVRGVDGQLFRAIAASIDHAARYRRLYWLAEPLAWTIGEGEHQSIVDACRDGEPGLAASRLARHLARTALAVMAQRTPEREPNAVRSALQLITGNHPGE